MSDQTTNLGRAERIVIVLAAYASHQGISQEESNICDLLTDVMHYCDQNGMDFDDDLKTAKRNFEAEVEGDGKIFEAADIPCYASCPDDYNFSDDWGNKLVNLWIATRKHLVAGDIRPDQFRDELIGGIINLSNWRSSFNQAASEVGADPDDDVLFEQWVALNKNDAFNLIPSNLHAELCWIPEWDGANLDDLLGSHGIQSDRFNSNYIEDVQPGNWLTVFLKLVNQSSEAIIAAAIAERGAEGKKFADKCQAIEYDIKMDDSRPSLMTPMEVISAIENAYYMAVPMFHCFVNVKALLGSDPTKAMLMSSDRKGRVHLGFHEFINGAGYMDTYNGEVIIPANAIGFAGEERWKWGVNKVYGLVKSCFYTTPTEI